MLESAAVRALLLSLAAGLSTLLGALVVFAAGEGVKSCWRSPSALPGV